MVYKGIMVYKNIFLLLAVSLCFLKTSLPQAKKEVTARDLFFAGSETVAAKSDKSVKAALGLRYSILKQKDNEFVEVDPGSTFYSGDKIRLSIEANEAGYVYIVNGGSSGRWELIFPSPNISGGKYNIEKHRRYQIPDTSFFSFEKPPGMEKVFIVLSRQPEPAMEKLIESLQQNPKAPPKPELAEKGKGGIEVVASLDDATVKSIRERVASRDLKFEDTTKAKTDEKAEKAVYVVNTTRSDDSRVVVDLSLDHR